MADPANIEALQARLRDEARDAVRCAVLQRLLVEFEADLGVALLNYRGLLHRAETVIAKELQALGEPSHA